ncbi:CHASE2 domain-containing protein [Marinobacter sp. SS5-14b]|uniref:CHASE2 domain-containing protein n=1 Tax=Marinobacter sp. SS5-14b TaxID=3050456 RepID=UPI0026DF994F|nr:CHASE2 domain-containing protein [Marinobacter sp. SS5-14b]
MIRDWLTIRTTPWSLGLLLLGTLALFQLTGLPERLNHWIYDKAITNWRAPVSSQVIIVAIDEFSLGRLGRWPWPRSTHGDLIDELHESGAETVVLDILFPEPSAHDPRLADAIRGHGQVVLPLHLSASTQHQLISEQMPVPQLAEAAQAMGHAHIELDSDGVARGIYLRNGLAGQLWPTLALAHQTVAVRQTSTGLPGYLNVRENYRRVPLAGGAGTLPTISYASVIEGAYPKGLFAGKTVFVGATAAGFGDILPTPFSGLSQPMPGVEFHANVYSANQQGLLITEAPRWLSPLINLLVLMILALLLPRLRPAGTVAACLSMFLTLTAGYLFLLLLFRLHLPAAHTLLLPLIAMPIASGLRLAMTNRFLNRQLDNMARTPKLSLPQPANRQPAQLLTHFRAFLQPEGWFLAEDNEILEAKGMTLAQAPYLPETGRWVHQLNQSWIPLTRGHSRYVIGLTLNNDLSREVTQRYLQQLVLEPDTHRQPGRHPRENISARIEKVQLATERLTQMQAFIQRSFQHMPDGIIVTDELAVIRFTNGHIEDWFREPMPSLSGMPLTSLLEGHDPRDNPPWHETVSETLTLKESRTVDLKVHGKDFLIHFAPFALPGSGQSGIIANISDISELREQQRQHREAIDFISHDVRSPLVSQLALIEQLKREPGHIDEHQLDQLGKLARRSYSLAEEFVQLARAEQLSETRFYECELLAIVENARDSVCEQALEKGIQLQLTGTEDLWLKGNAELLERAVINLLTNAVQYSPSGTTISVEVYRAGHLACLAIADEGSGIDTDELPYLFDRYHRQRRSELAGHHGTGLGLSFVKTVVEKHKGDITVDSTLDEGTTFTLKLPMADPMS